LIALEDSYQPLFFTESPLPSSHHIKKEMHYSQRNGWLRAAVLGANDGIVSTASLVLGVAAAESARSGVLLAGLAGLVAGAMSMAAGEFVSVSSQADSEKADLRREQRELTQHHEFERRELAAIYVKRGIDTSLAQQVADQLMAHDALDAHARDELGLTTNNTARPLQAAIASACTFATGAALPLGLAAISSATAMTAVVASGSLVTLAMLGALAAHAGGAQLLKGALRVTFWGAAAMAITSFMGRWFGVLA
jgi:VIT1/CCC1 family predicted Fe2+/Mn2+ transporter